MIVVRTTRARALFLVGALSAALNFVHGFVSHKMPPEPPMHALSSTWTNGDIPEPVANGAEATFDVDADYADASDESQSTLPDPSDDAELEERGRLKLELLKLAASYDRGYGATPSARKKTQLVIDDLESLNPTEDASRGISGDDPTVSAPLQGNWRMVWCTAQDVLSLASSPAVTVGAIYQCIDPPIATNVIDLIPRAQAFLPPGAQPSSILRAEVTTRASPRANDPNRVGLAFESVKLKPVEVLGFEVPFLPPLSFNLPRIPDIPGSTPESSPGYFDVTYLDDEMLIIRQNAPGGLFCLVKAEDSEP